MTNSLDISSMDDAVAAVKNGQSNVDDTAAALLSKLSIEERLWLLDGDEPFGPGLHAMTTKGFNHTPYIMGEVPRLNIPGVWFCDGPRGCVMGNSTAFPVPMARAASWDVALEERIGRAIGRECKAQGGNLFGGICVNLPRHPGWGRIQETYGEDPIILGKMGAAIAKGVQENVMACVKHLALNSMENARFKVDVRVDDDVYHEVYLPHFHVREADVDRPGHAILRSLIENEVLRGGSKPSKDVVFCEEHHLLARESATNSMVLLKNGPIDGKPLLPLQPDVASIAIVGWRANSENTGDKGSSNVRRPKVISPYQGIREVFPQANVTVKSSNDVAEVRRAAAAADVVVVVVGYDFRDEGEYTAPAFNATPGLSHVIPPDDGSEEAKSVITRLMNPAPKKEERGKDNYGFGTGGDRRSLRLRPDDVEVIRAAVEANQRTIVSIVAGGTVIIDEWKHLPKAIIFGWYPGCEGGHALADLLLGNSDFGGRLPFSIPTSERHLPEFDNDAELIKYERWYGQRLLDRLQVDAAYPLGFGMSYTTFAPSNLQVRKDEAGRERLLINVRVSNTGVRRGRYVAQVYGVVDAPEWPRRNLLGFEVIDLDRNEGKDVEIIASTRPFQRWNDGIWKCVSESVVIEVGAHSGDVESIKIT
ncbi:beta-glucosidase [Fusarium albosuccineum]|uniref:beta-glucosidase n=1 Tax=Fusarium albosuccineum TaxID=1237068 RepID=A0A8H4PMC2_9HYPO|nr:beta-glucosidase [Fusarium albosuccineum]